MCQSLRPPAVSSVGYRVVAGRARARLGLEPRTVDVELADLVTDDPLGGVQEPGRLGPVAAGGLEGVDDEVLLEAVHRALERDSRQRARHLRGLQRRGKMVAVDDA